MMLAIEKQLPDIKADDFRHHLKAEASKAWELYQSGIIYGPPAHAQCCHELTQEVLKQGVADSHVV